MSAPLIRCPLVRGRFRTGGGCHAGVRDCGGVRVRLLCGIHARTVFDRDGGHGGDCGGGLFGSLHGAHPGEAVVDPVDQRGGTVQQQTAEPVVEVEHPHPALRQSAPLVLFDDVGLQTGGDDPSHHPRSGGGVRFRNRQDRSLIFGAMFGGEGDTGVDDRGCVAFIDPPLPQRCQRPWIAAPQRRGIPQPDRPVTRSAADNSASTSRSGIVSPRYPSP